MLNPGEGPNLTAQQAAAIGREIIGAGWQRGALELPTITCSHCHAVRYVQPLRTRDRPYCRKCDHHICDECAVIARLNGGECIPLNQKIDILREQALKEGL